MKKSPEARRATHCQTDWLINLEFQLALNSNGKIQFSKYGMKGRVNFAFYNILKNLIRILLIH